MSKFMLVRHKIKDFNAWKHSYDAHAPMREASGLKEKYLLRNDLDQKEVIVLFTAEDLDRAKAFAASDDLRQAMQNAGVTDMPDVYFLSE